MALGTGGWGGEGDLSTAAILPGPPHPSLLLLVLLLLQLLVDLLRILLLLLLLLMLLLLMLLLFPLLLSTQQVSSCARLCGPFILTLLCFAQGGAMGTVATSPAAPGTKF